MNERLVLIAHNDGNLDKFENIGVKDIISCNVMSKYFTSYTTDFIDLESVLKASEKAYNNSQNDFSFWREFSKNYSEELRGKDGKIKSMVLLLLTGAIASYVVLMDDDEKK